MALKTNDTSRFLLEEATRIASDIALDIEIGVKSEMLKPKTGRRYGSHVASAPGEAPAVDTGRYIKDIEMTVEADGTRRVVAFVGAKNTPYSVRLETVMRREVWGKQAKRALKEFRGKFRVRRRSRL